MLPLLQRLEHGLIRLEERILVFLVLLMLSLAVYNVLYRNILVPIQTRAVLGSGYDDEPVDTPVVEPTPAKSEEATSSDEADDESGGFGGGFEDDAEDRESGFGGDFDEPKPAAKASEDDSGGFGGDFDESEPAVAEDFADESEGFGGDFEETKPADDESGGFGGDFEDAPADESGGFGGDFEDDEESGGFGGDFEGGTPSDTPAATLKPDLSTDEPLEGFPAFISESVDALKLEWIDTLLRQLVLFVGLMGAMLATQRRKHITVDALSLVLPKKVLPYIDVLTSLLSFVICVFLAIAGWDLVLISLEYPKELMSWADEWHFQMVFPIGFALLAFHFFVRVIESVAVVVWGENQEEAV